MMLRVSFALFLLYVNFVEAYNVSQEVLIDIAKIITGQLIAPPAVYALKTETHHVHFLFYGPHNQQTPLPLTSDNLYLINHNLPTKFIIHGWIQDTTRTWVQAIKNAYLKRGPYNIVLVDWSDYANGLYGNAYYHVPGVGRTIAHLIHDLTLTNYDLGKIHLIGFSLGGHVSGYAGQYIKNLNGAKIQRISGLDVAGPLYDYPIPVPKDFRLSKDDANFVDGIHTNGGLGGFGYGGSYGHIDFFPNDGRSQPNCPTFSDGLNLTATEYFLTFVFCSHIRSVFLWLEAIDSRDFVARRCFSYEAYKLFLCENQPSDVLGEDSVGGYHGDYFLKTNDMPPFAKG